MYAIRSYYGFFSKDGLLAAAYAHGTPFYLTIYILGAFTALLTAIYTFRLLYLVFGGTSRFTGDLHGLPKLMTWPLIPLALIALFSGVLNLPEIFGGHQWLDNNFV